MVSIAKGDSAMSIYASVLISLFPTAQLVSQLLFYYFVFFIARLSTINYAVPPTSPTYTQTLL